MSMPTGRYWCQQWMIDEGLSTGKTSPPTRELIVQWVKMACDDMSSRVLWNAWRHHKYSWFPEQQQLPVLQQEVTTEHEEEEEQEQQQDEIGEEEQVYGTIMV